MMVTDLGCAYISNIEPEIIASNRFQNVIKHGRFQEHEVNDLDVREVGHEFQSDTHLGGEAKILEQDGHSCGRKAPADTNGKGDLGVDFLSDFFWGHIGDVVGGEGHSPVHDNYILLSLGECTNAVDAKCLVSESEGCETKRIEERRTVG